MKKRMMDHSREQTIMGEYMFFPPGSASEEREKTGGQFWARMHRRNLDAISAISADPEKYKKLLSAVPPICIEKFPECMSSTESKIQVLVNLFSKKQNGEITEVVPDQYVHWRMGGWKLTPIVPLPDSVSSVFDLRQFFCKEDHTEVGVVKDGSQQYGHVITEEGKMLIQLILLQIATKDDGIRPHDLVPMWSKQRNRIEVPCRNAAAYMWQRSGWCTALGLLLKQLGTEFDAATIYEYYLLNRIVALKRYVPAPKKKPAAAKNRPAGKRS